MRINEPLKSCRVSPYTKCNKATITSEDATIEATHMQQADLMTLSMRVLERNKNNRQCNLATTNELHTLANNQTNMVDAFSDKSCQVVLSKGGNLATEELRALINKISQQYGGDDPAFLAEYIKDIIKEWSHDLDKAFTCFRNLAKQIPPVNNRK